jgi:tetratricopeptide (TPR) repeat protein
MTSGEDITAMTTYAMLYLLPIGRIPHAIQLYTDAEKLDPLRAGYKANLAYLLLWSGDAEAAILKAQEALELNPQHFFALTAMAEAYRKPLYAMPHRVITLRPGKFTGMWQGLPPYITALR